MDEAVEALASRRRYGHEGTETGEADHLALQPEIAVNALEGLEVAPARTELACHGEDQAPCRDVNAEHVHINVLAWLNHLAWVLHKGVCELGHMEQALGLHILSRGRPYCDEDAERVDRGHAALQNFGGLEVLEKREVSPRPGRHTGLRLEHGEPQTAQVKVYANNANEDAFAAPHLEVVRHLRDVHEAPNLHVSFRNPHCHEDTKARGADDSGL
mmetsp:Transcript_33878/g.74137  ORF Transcript_33878/g.74137 Transcript_33878/m.74137 type:complete len:215 (+) Transcript_33878:463-1107(+)